MRIHSGAITQCSGNTKGNDTNPAAQYTPEQVQASGWFENQMNQVDFILASSGPMADLRASLGHPQPYNMSMLALGNEVRLLLPVACRPQTQISTRQSLWIECGLQNSHAQCRTQRLELYLVHFIFIMHGGDQSDRFHER